VRGKIEGFSVGGFAPGQQADRELLLHEIDGRLLDLEQIRRWERNPDRYASGITYSVFLGAYQKWLLEDLLPRSNSDFRIGAESYRKKLLYDEMVDTPLDMSRTVCNSLSGGE